jgi:hypothetical protein
MNIEDFLPKYPNINTSKYDILNPLRKTLTMLSFTKRNFTIID